jgi:hypothetical protein
MITREATLVERKAIGRKALVDILAPEIWNMLHELSDNGFYITLSYFGRVIHWRYKDYIVEAFVSCVHTYRYDLPEFKDMLLDYEPTYVLRMHKLCLKNLRDEKSVRGNARKEAEMDAAMERLREYDKKRRANKPVKIKIDLELQAWI